MDRLASNGGSPGPRRNPSRVRGGPPPFGFKRSGRGRVEDPYEQGVLKVIRLLAAEGETDGGIAAFLNRYRLRPRRAETWSAGTVRSVRLLDQIRAGQAASATLRAAARARTGEVAR
jgi:hypothetical protein